VNAAPHSRSLLVWYGVLGAPVAWASSHVVGWIVTETACSTAGNGWAISVNAWSAALLLGAGTIAAGAEAAAIWSFRRTRGAGEDLPGARLHFLSVIGILLGILFFTLIVISAIGSIALTECVQS
jgi:hypothetical protein